ncbi:hypothetical protein KBX06_03235 [Micromonospora sp. C31]|uniref:hypothetical protein n=1 Tax=Micromonospora sp. C31 TaxID=2824876 RepID=UPI001B375913|nr:hypothetical protein [Micromonospora sp. C31]MBQ1072183.1 hypothetical protein [Micromonospora sp. C31]
MNSISEGRAAGVDFRVLRGRVRADRRGTSTPLLVFGLVTAVFALSDNVWGRYVPAPFYWPMATLVALIALGLLSWRLALRTGVGEGRRSYGRLAVLYLAGMLLIASSWWFAGMRPLLWPVTALFVIGILQRDRALTVWSGVAAALSLLAWLYLLLAPGTDVTHSVIGLGYEWTETLIFAGTGVVLIVGGALLRRRERLVA